MLVLCPLLSETFPSLEGIYFSSPHCDLHIVSPSNLASSILLFIICVHAHLFHWTLCRQKLFISCLILLIFRVSSY